MTTKSEAPDLVTLSPSKGVAAVSPCFDKLSMTTKSEAPDAVTLSLSKLSP
jgi:hypothetical protein